MKIDPTVERLSFDNFSDTTAEHLHRYAITLEFIIGMDVLDIASGEGYGSFIMAEKAKYVYGVDIDSESIFTAQEKYKRANLKYLEGNAVDIPLEENSIDVVVSFETIEHHDMHQEMFQEIKRVLKPDGILIMSSPDKTYYSDKTGYNNEYHIRELYFVEFQAMCQAFFEHTDFYFQKSMNLNSYISCDEDFDRIIVYSGDQKTILTEQIEPLYNLVIASNNILKKLQPTIYNGNLLSNRRMLKRLKQQEATIKNSNSFRLGQCIIKPFKFLRKFF